MYDVLKQCILCPRKCKVDRTKGEGFCMAGAHLKAARAALHQWEEPCISGANGSGAVFFSGCPLKCCYCQNYQVSAHGFGADITVNRLVEIFKRLETEGAHNINLVTATPYIPYVIDALKTAKLNIPIVYNTSSYETPLAIEMLAPYVDVWLADLKYVNKAISKKYSQAADYFDIASAAIMQMSSYSPILQYDNKGMMQKGLIVRHLVLPSCINDTKAALDWLAQGLNKSSFLLSLMSQYTPFYNAYQYAELSRKVSSYEYKKAIEHAVTLGLDSGLMQSRTSATEDYTPPFELQGL